jgi:PAS domain S-box-containing protein
MPSLNRWVVMALGIAVTSILMIAIAGYVGLGRLTRAAEVLDRSDQRIGALALLADHFARGQGEEQSYLILGDTAVLTLYRTTQGAILSLVQRLEEASPEGERREELVALLARVRRYLEGADERLNLRADGRRPPGTDGQDVRNAEQVLAALRSMHDRWTADAADYRAHQIAIADRTRRVLLVTLISAAALAVAAALLVHRAFRARDRARTDRDRIFEFASELIIVANADGTFRNVNPAWKEVLGWERGDLIGRPFLEFVHPEDKEATIAEFARVASGAGRTVSFENRYRAKDGTYRRLAWTGTPVMPGGIVYGLARDVTALRAVEAEVDQLRGLLPICSSCHKIRATDGGWTQLETYIARRSGAEFTHSICPDCSHRLYGG